MPTKIFVGNIALETSRDSLMPLFQRYGQVTECDVLGSYGFVVSIEVLSCYYLLDIIIYTLPLCVNMTSVQFALVNLTGYKVDCSYKLSNIPLA